MNGDNHLAGDGGSLCGASGPIHEDIRDADCPVCLSIRARRQREGRRTRRAYTPTATARRVGPFRGLQVVMGRD